MTIWRKQLQFINVMLANRSSTIVAERGSGRMTYATKKNPLQNTTCASRFSAQVKMTELSSEILKGQLKGTLVHLIVAESSFVGVGSLPSNK